MRYLLAVLIFFLCIPAFALNKYNGVCSNGAIPAKTNGLNSSNTLQSSYPQCSVLVSIHGAVGVFSISINNSGSGQTNGTYILNGTGGGGSGAQVQITVSGGKITLASVFSQGSGYTSTPSFVVSEGGTPGTLTSVLGPILAVIYADNNPSPTPLANPFTALSSGSYGFYTNPGEYDITMSGGLNGGFPSPYTLADIIITSASSGGGVNSSSIPFPIAFYQTSGAIVSPNLITGDLSGNLFVPRAETLGGSGNAGTINILDTNGNQSSLSSINGATAGRSIATSIQPQVNAMAYGATGISLPGVANYVAGNQNITISSGSGFKVGQLLILKGASFVGSPVAISSCSTTAGIVTFTTAPQAFKAGTPLFIQGFSGPCTGFNGLTLTVSITGLSSSQFEASTSLNLTGSDTGSAVQPTDLLGKIATVSGNIITGTTVTWGSSTMTPTLNVTGAAIGWSNDDTAALQSAITQACSQPRGPVGANFSSILIPQGEFAITSPLIATPCGHITGIGGSAGTRLVWWGANGTHAGTCGTGAELQIGNSPSSMIENMQFFTISKNFVPDCTIEAAGFLDQEAHWHDLTFQSASQVATIWLDNYPLNGRLDHIASRDFCGDFIHVVPQPGLTRADFPISYSTVDFGSVVSVTNNCKAQSVVDEDVSGFTGYPGTLILEHLRIETQSGTVFNTTDTSKPPLIKFSTGGVTTSFHVGEVRVDDVTFNILGAATQQVAISGTTDTQGLSCPPLDFTNIVTNGSIVAGWSSPTGTWCNGLPIQQIPEILDSAALQNPNIIPRWQPNMGGDSSSSIWTGNVPENKIVDSGFFLPSNQTPWTTPSGWSECISCGYLNSNGIKVLNTGSTLSGTLPQSAAIAVIPGEIYEIGGWVDCSNLTAGTAGYLVQGNGGLQFTTKCLSPGVPLTQIYDFVTIPAGNTSVVIQPDPFGTTGTVGTYTTFSRPQFNLIYSPTFASAKIPNTPVPYQLGISLSSPPLTRIVLQSCLVNADISVTGTTAQTLLYACQIPAMTIGVHGRILARADFTGGTTSCNYTARLTTSSGGITGGSSVSSGAITSTHSPHLELTIADRNATNSQYMAAQWTYVVNGVLGATATPAIDMTAVQYLSLAVTPGSVSDTCTLNQSLVEYIP